MIAKPDPHYQSETLSELLDDRLSQEEAHQVQSHLDECETCRQRLVAIAGQPGWWEETLTVLSTTTLGTEHRGDILPIDRDLDESVQWVRPLLEPGDVGELGRLDEYPIHDVVGQGGMGVVLRGVDPDLNRAVAIKVLSPHLSGVGAARMRFMREAKAAAAIVHPSIVPIYRIATTGRLPYIVMPHIAGGNLQERINRDGPLELVEVLRIALQVAEGIAAAHRHGVIHRDIKPANILVEEGNGRVLISDFGLARALNDATLTMSGMITGTPQFMSPEQAEGEAVDERSDLYSLGSLIYALATGRAPFHADSPLAVLRKISESQPRPIQETNEQQPAWLDLIVGQFMQTDRTKRIQTAHETVSLLRESLAHVRNPTTAKLPLALQANTHSWRAVAVVSTTIAVLMTCILFVILNDRFRQIDSPTDRGQQANSSNGLIPDPDLAERTVIDPADLQWSGQSLEEGISELNSDLDSIGHSMGY